MTRVLVYYFAFPHYRAEILKELKQRVNSDILIASGTVGRDSIRPLTSEDIDFLSELESIQIGPFQWQKGIVSRAISRDFDVVVLGPATLSLSTWAILLARRLMRRKTYLWGNCGKPGDRSTKRFIQEVLNRAAHGLLVYGVSEAKAAAALGTSPQKVHIVNNATYNNTEWIAPEYSLDVVERLRRRTKEALEGRRLVLAFVGRLTEGKGLPSLFEAARRLRTSHAQLQVVVIGSGSAEETLKKKYSDPYIHFVGAIYDKEELAATLKDVTLIVSPHDMGLVAIDALRLGIPVLVPDNPFNGPEVEALTEGVNSRKFAHGDSAAIADAVEQWLRNAPQINEEDYVQARESALGVWSPESVAGRILDVVQE